MAVHVHARTKLHLLSPTSTSSLTEKKKIKRCGSLDRRRVLRLVDAGPCLPRVRNPAAGDVLDDTVQEEALGDIEFVVRRRAVLLR